MRRNEVDPVERDLALARSVLAELDWHALIDATQLAVGVEDSIVTVVGTLPSLAQKLVVLDAVESVDGVRGVVSHVDVKPTLQPSETPVNTETSVNTDVELERIVGQVMKWNALVPENEVSHVVVDGWVTLGGTVATATQRTEAEHVVAHILGVRGVTNEIELAPPILSPADIRATIVEALERHAAHQARDIGIVVDGNRVTLSGSVESPLEKRAVLGAVSHAPGVETVCQGLVVRPLPKVAGR